MNRKLVVFAAAVAFAVLAGCARMPSTEVEASRAALDQARQGEAVTYAPQSLHAAEEAYSRLEAELKAQEERFALRRTYDKARELAAEAQAASEQAVADAAAGKERMKNEATTLLADVRTAITELRELLEKAPRGKGTRVDIAVMKSDLASIETTISEIDGSLAAGDFQNAKVKAEAAKRSAEQIRAAINTAMTTRKAT